MQWADFGPYVLPYVIGCPQPTMELHAKMAAIEFCRRTKGWVTPLEAFQTSGQLLLELDDVPERARIVEVEFVQVAGLEWPILDAITGARRAQADDGRAFCYPVTEGLMIYPQQAAGVEVLVRASLIPTLQATTLATPLQEHIDAIAAGAIASLMRIPGQAFSSASSGEFEALFRERIKAESSRLARGNITATVRALPSFL